LNSDEAGAEEDEEDEDEDEDDEEDDMVGEAPRSHL